MIDIPARGFSGTCSLYITDQLAALSQAIAAHNFYTQHYSHGQRFAHISWVVCLYPRRTVLLLVPTSCLVAALWNSTFIHYAGYEDLEARETSPSRFLSGYRSWAQMIVRLVVSMVLLVVLDLIWFQLARLMGVDYFGAVEARIPLSLTAFH